MTNQFENEEVRYLGWKQPFASLMLHDKIETRTWHTKYRGLVLITASKTPYSEYDIMGIAGEVGCQRILNFLNQNGVKEQLGHAIAIGRLVDCRPMQKEDEDKCFVQYYPDLFCHVYENVKAIIPFEMKGAQGWRKLDQETKNKIKII